MRFSIPDMLDEAGAENSARVAGEHAVTNSSNGPGALDRRAVLSLCGMAASAFAVGGCSVLFPNELTPVPFGLSMVVDTPEGSRAAMNKLELQLSTRGDPKNSTWMYSTGTLFEAYGQALVLDLGSRGHLFALLRSDTDPFWVTNAPLWQQKGLSDPTAAEQYVEQGFPEDWPLPRHFQRNEAGEWPSDDVPATAYPTLLRFRDPQDPLTVEKVDPDNLAQTFGEGITLRQLNMHVREPALAMAQARLHLRAPPTDIRALLPWLSKLGDQFLAGGATYPVFKLDDQPLAAGLKRQDFLLER
jgi:hypothetical protein